MGITLGSLGVSLDCLGWLWVPWGHSGLFGVTLELLGVALGSLLGSMALDHSLVVWDHCVVVWGHFMASLPGIGQTYPGLTGDRIFYFTDIYLYIAKLRPIQTPIQFGLS